MNKIKFKNIIYLIFIFTVYLMFFLFEDKFNYITKKIYILILFFLLLLFFLYLLIEKKSIKKNKKEHFERINKLFSYSDKLLNAFYDFYNKSISLITYLNKENKDYRKKFDITYSSNELYEKLNELYNKIDNLISITSQTEINFKEGLKDPLFNNNNNNDIKKMILNFKYNSEIAIDFIKSIASNITELSNPLSEGIYKIKLTVNNFLDNISKWREQFTNEENEKNFNKIIVKYGEHNEEFKKIVCLVDEKFTNLEKNLNIIVKIIIEINKNTLNIQEIAEKIRLLSINSSIEATRAGEAGKGFKIVSEEIKKLSNETQNIVNIIIPNINESKKIVSKVLNNFEIECNEIIHKIDKQKNEFNLFYQRLNDYYNDLNSILNSVSEVINQINENTDKITPTFQMSNLTIQELENLDKILIKFLENNKDQMEIIIKSIDKEKKVEILEKILEFISKIITTKPEVELINKIIEKFGLDEKKFVIKNDKDIELF